MAHSPAQTMSTPNKIKILRTRAELKSALDEIRAAAKTIGFVPTMGALHGGHLSLIDIAKQKSDICVVSIFVNPKQFSPNEDYVNYPRDEAADLAQCAELGADLIYLPTPDDLYPFNYETSVNPGPAALGLESDFRPGFFSGVVSAVEQLLDAVNPDVAVFGEKDYQQLCVIKQAFPNVNVIGAPIVRDALGLALSSRNAYLSQDELIIAEKLNRILFLLADEIRDFPQEAYDLIPSTIQDIIDIGFDEVDYLELRTENTLDSLQNWNQKPARILVAAHLGKTRLIDNVRV